MVNGRGRVVVYVYERSEVIIIVVIVCYDQVRSFVGRSLCLGPAGPVPVSVG